MHGQSTPLSRRHYHLLALILMVAIALRVWHLGTRALWLDEVIGALFTLGKGLDAVPLETIFSLTDLPQIFALEPGLSCQQITQTVAIESVHPPLFFCLQYAWISRWLPFLSDLFPSFADTRGWVWVLRSLPALIGVLDVLSIYGLGRMVMTPRTGLIAAALMAVSPFAVYLSQEARHYTLPMLWTILALMALVKLQRCMLNRRALPVGLLLGWTVMNSLGLYTHYFFLLDFVAQIIALGGWLVWTSVWGQPTHEVIQGTTQRLIAGENIQPGKRLHQYMGKFLLSVTVVMVSYAPWIPTLISHINRPETDWLKPYKPDWGDRIAPLYQTLMGWILMVVNLPVESQPWAIAIPSVLIMVSIGGWLGWTVFQGLKRIGIDTPPEKAHSTHRPALHLYRPTLHLFCLLFISLIVQTLAIVYLLDKDITAIPRYNFISYPVVLILIAMGLSSFTPSPSLLAPRSFRSLYHPLTLCLCMGFLSTLFVIHGVVFQKGYYPQRVAQDMARFPHESLLVVVSHRSLQEVALGLSFGLELQRQSEVSTASDAKSEAIASQTTDPSLMFVDRSQGFGPAWRQLKHASHALPLPLNMWAIAAPGMKTKDYPETLTIRRPNRRAKVNCAIDPNYFNRIGFPYQLFRCPL